MAESKRIEDDVDRESILEQIQMQPSTASRVIVFESDELTAFCPFDFGGPDFYELTIKYLPPQEPVEDVRGVESRSLKEYVESWRNAEISAEDLAQEIYGDIAGVVNASVLYVRLEQARRGGIEETVEVGHDPHEVRN